ncbi:conserved hypothetical protein [Methanocaldococcus sp. FS406-22]|uniref:hypothetical protein n=1 Tax=Methanocaldococcus sp. (strain FS406-22) TaxID=644281 RepID=UPI0001BF3509|nr:hypothetical protein [Methanocaldococcus sp. FS406-22]ADC69800.1 conserved hypothetical protein [Methanocaldococcus sp. FS406-22]
MQFNPLTYFMIYAILKTFVAINTKNLNREILLLYEYILKYKTMPTKAIPVIYFIKYQDPFEAYKNYLENTLDHLNDLTYNAFLILNSETPNMMTSDLYDFFLEVSKLTEEQKMRIVLEVAKKIKEEKAYVRSNSQY